MFDVDGTLVRSLDIESLLFPKACELGLAIESVSSDWSSYNVPSDRGIVSELVEIHKNRSVTAMDLERVETQFHAMLKSAFQKDPNACLPVKNALEMFEYVQKLTNTKLAIATAGWESTARLKLKQAGFEIGQIPFASANDGLTKLDIMRIAKKAALTHYDCAAFDSVIYVGDSSGDAQASETMGCHFIQIESSHSSDNATFSFLDFSELKSFVSNVVELQDLPSTP